MHDLVLHQLIHRAKQEFPGATIAPDSVKPELLAINGKNVLYFDCLRERPYYIQTADKSEIGPFDHFAVAEFALMFGFETTLGFPQN